MNVHTTVAEKGAITAGVSVFVVAVVGESAGEDVGRLLYVAGGGPGIDLMSAASAWDCTPDGDILPGIGNPETPYDLGSYEVFSTGEGILSRFERVHSLRNFVRFRLKLCRRIKKRMMQIRASTPTMMPAIVPLESGMAPRALLPFGEPVEVDVSVGCTMEGVPWKVELEEDVGVRSVVDDVDNVVLLLLPLVVVLELLVVGMLDVVEDDGEKVLTTVMVIGPVIVTPPMTRFAFPSSCRLLLASRSTCSRRR